jgi:hypothetical protein
VRHRGTAQEGKGTAVRVVRRRPAQVMVSARAMPQERPRGSLMPPVSSSIRDWRTPPPRRGSRFLWARARILAERAVSQSGRRQAATVMQRAARRSPACRALLAWLETRGLPRRRPSRGSPYRSVRARMRTATRATSWRSAGEFEQARHGSTVRVPNEPCRFPLDCRCICNASWSVRVSRHPRGSHQALFQVRSSPLLRPLVVGAQHDNPRWRSGLPELSLGLGWLRKILFTLPRKPRTGEPPVACNRH